MSYFLLLFLQVKLKKLQNLFHRSELLPVNWYYLLCHITLLNINIFHEAEIGVFFFCFYFTSTERLYMKGASLDLLVCI